MFPLLQPTLTSCAVFGKADEACTFDRALSPSVFEHWQTVDAVAITLISREGPGEGVTPTL